MRYVGALAEFVEKRPMDFIPEGWPGRKELRDIFDVVLLARAELNAIGKLLLEKNLVTQEDWDKRLREEYDWYADQLGKKFGFEVTDAGLTFRLPLKEADGQHRMEGKQ